ncbi:hypothetical protein RB595_006128 [Gaeumannomyces hyphopodioides]
MDSITVDEDEILQRFDSLVESGIVFYDNREVVPFSQDGFHFLFFVAPSLSKKPFTYSAPNGNNSRGQGEERAATKAGGDAAEQQPRPPLLEPGSDISAVGFEICDVGAAHRLIANKFCFTRPMLLLMTRDGFKRQHDPLEAPDLAAAWAVLRAMRTSHFVFYNCGEPSGNSRLHRHVQLTRRPEGFTTFLDHEEGGGGGRPSVPFMYFREPLMRKGEEGEEDGASTPVTGESLAKVYGELLGRAEASSSFRWDGPGTSCPHNLVMTEHWMAVIPRRRAVWEGLSTNAIGMLGLVGVASRGEADKWIRAGPLEALGHFGIPHGA